MVCIYCGAKTQVTNSRLQKQANNVWRRRQCIACKGIFTTHEAPDLAAGFMVASTRSDMRPFSRDTLLVSVYESCKHRENALTDASALTQTILNKLVPTAQNGLLDPNTITSVTQDVLSRFDATAGTIYAAYHPAKT